MYIEISRYLEFKSIFVYMYNVNFWKKGDQLNRNLMIVYIKKNRYILEKECESLRSNQRFFYKWLINYCFVMDDLGN